MFCLLQGAALLLSGIVAAIITAPLFDRVFTHHLGLAARIFAPIIAACWLALIWAVRPNNTAALYALFVLIGVFSVTMLPVGLELGCELTRNSSASAAILWWRCVTSHNIPVLRTLLMYTHLVVTYLVLYSCSVRAFPSTQIFPDSKYLCFGF